MKQTMQKAICVFFVALFLMIPMTVGVFAAESVTVLVTICDGNEKLPMVNQKLKVSDLDEDGEITLNDVLLAAHEKEYQGGAEVGYTAENGQVTLLWGKETAGHVGFYQNHKAQLALDAPCKDGDSIVAFLYSTAEKSDVYTYFTTEAQKLYSGEEYVFTLNYVTATGAVKPLADAEVYIDGKKTEYITDENGQFVFEPQAAGIFRLSAKAERVTVIPSAYQLVVNGPKTGDDAPILTYAFIAVLSMGILVALVTNKPQTVEE